MVSFNNSAGDQISFDQNGELVAGFDIINWVTFPNQSFVKVKVGRLDLQAVPITINEDAIVWHSWFNQVGLKCRQWWGENSLIQSVRLQNLEDLSGITWNLPQTSSNF